MNGKNSHQHFIHFGIGLIRSKMVFWSEVRDLYLEKKNNNRDLNKKSTSLRREAVNEVFLKHFDVEE